MYARCVRWFKPEDMTGAKLLGMHESVTSPKEYRSRHVPSGMWRCWRRAGELCGRRGGLKPSGVTSGQRPRLLGGYRAQWLYGRWLEGSDLSGDSDCRPPKPRPRLDALRIGWLQARHPGAPAPRSTATSPLPGDKGAEPRRSHTACPKPWETCVFLPSCRTCSGIHPSTKESGAAPWTPEQVRGDAGR